MIVALFFSANVLGCQDSGISVKLVNQRRVSSEGHADPLLVREVTWRIKNETGCSIYVKGHKGSKFFPIGVTLTHYPNTKKWRSPYGGSGIPSYDELGMGELDQVEVKPNTFFEFTSRLGDAAPSVKFKQVLYASIGDSGATPKTIVSPIFSFKGSLN